MIKPIVIVIGCFLIHHSFGLGADTEDGNNSKELSSFEAHGVHSLHGIQTIDEIVSSEAVGCGNYALHSGESVDFQTPNFPDNYPKDYKCIWRFTCPSENSAMEVNCDRFELEANHVCFTDYLEIFNDFRSLGKYCGKDSPTGLIIKSNYMKAIFHSNWDRITRAGFRCRVKCMDEQIRAYDPKHVSPLVLCGSYQMDPFDSLIIRSKNYPKSYPKNHKCMWRFTCSSPNTDMRLYCDSFALQNTRTCNDDYLQVSNGTSSLGKFCGKKGPKYLHSNSNYMKVNFRSNGDRITRHGFHCIVRCKEKKNVSPKFFEDLPEKTSLKKKNTIQHSLHQIFSQNEPLDTPNDEQHSDDFLLENLDESSKLILSQKNKLAAYPKLEEVVSNLEENKVNPGLKWIVQLASKVHSSKAEN